MKKLIQKNRQCFYFSVLLLATIFNVPAYAQNHSIVGYWQTFDDKTQQPKAVIEVTKQAGIFSGKIVKIFANPNAVCKKCSGNLRNQPLMGMEIVSNFSQSGNQWQNGKVLSVERGKAYPALLSLSPNAEQLKVTVKAGLGTHKETWSRVQAP